MPKHERGLSRGRKYLVFFDPEFAEGEEKYLVTCDRVSPRPHNQKTAVKYQLFFDAKILDFLV